MVPDRLVTQDVGVPLVSVVQGEGAQAPVGAVGPVGYHGIATDEVALLRLYEAVQSGLVGRVDGAVLGGPAPKRLVEAQGVQGP